MSISGVVHAGAGTSALPASGARVACRWAADLLASVRVTLHLLLVHVLLVEWQGLARVELLLLLASRHLAALLW
jgi:hypothetical protein